MKELATSFPKASYLAHQEEIDRAIKKVLMSGQYLKGQAVADFEQEFAAYLGVKYAVGVSSGTDALRLALSALGVGPGDEVITVSFTCTPTVAAIEQTGAKVVLVDIEPDLYTMDASQVAGAITPRTKAIVPVHLYGQMADMAALKTIADQFGLWLVEDACQAHGAALQGIKAGSWGHAGCFSFYPTKNLGAVGDGGMVVTAVEKVAKAIRLWREYGWERPHFSVQPGINSRLAEIQAAILGVKLRYLEEENNWRQQWAERYQESLRDSGVILPVVRQRAKHAWYQFVIRTRDRDGLQQGLGGQGIGTSVHYPTPVHQQPAYLNRLTGGDKLPVTEQVAQEILSLPMYPQLTLADVSRVARSIKNYLKVGIKI